MRWIASLFAVCSVLCGQSTREVLTEAPVGAGPLPGFYKGYLYFIDPYDHVRLFSPDGHFVTRFTVQDHGEERGYIEGVAIDSDGTIAIGWGTRYGPYGIEIRNPSGDLIRSIDTGLFCADNVDFAADHSLWAFGRQRAAPHAQIDARDYPMLRHYSPDGKEIRAFLPRSLFPPGMPPGGPLRHERRIFVMQDLIGIVAYSGKTGVEQEWMEVDLNGNVLGRWRLDGMSFTAASITSDGQVYARRRDPKTQRDDIVVRLDREKSNWQALSVSTKGYFYGADGDQLVFGSWNTGVMKLQWVKQPSQTTGTER